ncbi:MAG: reverse transcriptase/maturase family protein, partial [Candidatus Paceibacterota bacterium]
MMKKFQNVFKDSISVERLFESWYLFQKGKRKRQDVQEFGRHVEVNIFDLHYELAKEHYQHGEYHSFYIHDPKIRRIRKASVRDRLVHQAIYTTLYQIYDPKFICHLYYARVGKGTHRAINALSKMIAKVSSNHTATCWSLKCDIQKFYDTVDQEILFNLIAKVIIDPQMLWLIKKVINSYHFEGTPGKGMPIGNLTSQIFTNIYLNELDQFVKHKLKVKYYLRFADDLMFLSRDKNYLEKLLPEVESFIKSKLNLNLHPNKIEIRPDRQGIDYLGFVSLPHYRLLRTKTRKRMIRNLRERQSEYFENKIN